jgi:hypothetical protein
VKENRKSEECGTKGKGTETECVLVGKVRGRNRLENPDVRCDDKTTRKMDLINGVGECGLNSSGSEASGGTMSAAERR